MSDIIFKTILLKGEAGNDIQGIEKTVTEGLIDTYTITLTDGTTHTFDVTNGKAVVSIEKTATEGLVDTYTIAFNDGTTSTFEVTNGSNIATVEKTATEGLVDTYTVTLTNGSTTTFEVTNGSNIESVEKTATEGLVDTYTITLTNGATSTFEVTNGRAIETIEKTASEGWTDTYTITFNDGSSISLEFEKATVDIDTELSDTSTKPVENRVVTEKLKTLQVKSEAKKWFCFADSYGAFDDSYTVKLKSLFGSRFNYKAQSGMRYMNTPAISDRYPFKDKLNEWLPTIADKNTYTDILIELGTNDIDSYSEANLISGFNECIDLIHNGFPTAIIHIGIVSKDMRGSRWNTRQQIIKKLKELCGTRTYTTWISGNENILGAKNQTWDLLHPTTDASNYIAGCLAEYMVGGNCPQYTQEETITNLVRSGATLQLHEEYSNGVYTLYISGDSAGGFSTTKDGALTKIGTVSMPIIHRAITVNGWINTYLEYLGTVYRNIIPASILLLPSESDNNVDVYLSWAYSSFYRDGSGNAIPWQQEMTIASFTFSGQQTSQIQ